MTFAEFPEVVIDADPYKFIVAAVTCGDEKKTVVRARDKASCPQHADIAAALTKELHDAGIDAAVRLKGGGFMRMTATAIVLFGRSTQYGRDFRPITVRTIEDAMKGVMVRAED
ncbi:MAG: hypothetical protein RLZZ324_460 [Candidatus Parcubacteria bacterium]|jgi:predicted nucleic acid-binding Zn ribbon protein